MTALHRRLLLGAGLAMPLAGSIATPALAQQDIGRAASFVQTTGQDLVAAINDTRSDLATRRAHVAAVLRKAVDIDGVGRFILGRWWRQATPAEQAEYIKLFEETLIRNLSARFGEYQGVRSRSG